VIDIHAHILPGLDDGPKTMDESLEMCRIAHKEGVHTIVATPHTLDGLYVNDKATIRNGVDALNAALAGEAIPIRILPGAEVHACIELADLYERGEIQTLNDSSYILVEFPNFGIPDGFDEVFFRLKMRGARIIIAHPERNMAILRNPELLAEYISQGALAQLTTGSLTGRFGSKVGKFAQHLLRHRLAHVLSSDAHSVRNRPPHFSNALRTAATILENREEAMGMALETPTSIVNDMEPPCVTPVPLPKKRRFFGLYA
jgi:protein-tyrosine phosphatase